MWTKEHDALYVGGKNIVKTISTGQFIILTLYRKFGINDRSKLFVNVLI